MRSDNKNGYNDSQQRTTPTINNYNRITKMLKKLIGIIHKRGHFDFVNKLM